MKESGNSHWSDYWADGNLTALAQKSNYDAETSDFWIKQFKLLRAGAAVLDVCSGNGAIALLAQDYSSSNKLGFTVSAIDAAGIDVMAVSRRFPEFAQHLQRIDFRGNTRIEDLQNREQSVDLVTSQFGIEYTDWQASAKTIWRLLRRGGYLSLISHAVDSGIVDTMQKHIEEFSLLTSAGLFELENKLERGEISRRQFTLELDRTLATIYAPAKASNSEYLLSIGQYLDPLCKLSLPQIHDGQKKFISHCRMLRSGNHRLKDLYELQRKLQQYPRWYEAFSDQGMELVSKAEIHQFGKVHVGNGFQFRKPERSR